jgi:hypothetical protein
MNGSVKGSARHVRVHQNVRVDQGRLTVRRRPTCPLAAGRALPATDRRHALEHPAAAAVSRSLLVPMPLQSPPRRGAHPARRPLVLVPAPSAFHLARPWQAFRSSSHAHAAPLSRVCRLGVRLGADPAPPFPHATTHPLPPPRLTPPLPEPPAQLRSARSSFVLRPSSFVLRPPPSALRPPPPPPHTDTPPHSPPPAPPHTAPHSDPASGSRRTITLMSHGQRT